MDDQKRIPSDAAWYCRRDQDAERFYEIFFKLCRKYHVSWASASAKEKAFVEEITRVTFEREQAQLDGAPLTSVRESFAS